MQLSFLQVSTERLQKTLPSVLAMVFMILIGLEAARLIWLVVPAPEQGSWNPRPISPSQAGAQADRDRQKLNIQPMLAAQLFGDYQEQASEPVVSDVDAPETNLRLKLRGIFAMPEGRQSRALIEANNGELKSYAVGMSIPGGATLHAIDTDRVLLRRGGRLETLKLEKDRLAGASTVTRNRSSGRRGSASRVLDSSTAAKLSNIRNELLNDPTKASNYLRVQPARSNGQMKGYRIYPGRNRDLFREAGLRPGDIVTAINGVTLNDPSRSLQLLSDLSSAQQINIQIERGGNPQSLSVNLN